MSGSLVMDATYLLVAVAVGAILGWFIRSVTDKRNIDALSDEWSIKFDDAARQRDRFNSENGKLRTSLEAQHAAARKHEASATVIRTELDSAREKLKLMSKNLFTIGAERDELKSAMNTRIAALNSVRQQAAEIQLEFTKAGDFYKGELKKSFDKRQTLEKKIEGGKAERDSLNNQLEAARSESQSVGKMLTSAQNRLDNLDAIEQNAIRLEADNAELRHESARVNREVAALQREVAEFEELKIQNSELSHCLKSIESSRKQYEKDAKRYRTEAENSEHHSDTLRVRLEDVEGNLAKMAREQDKALQSARKKAARKTNGEKPPVQEIDDLTEIVGIGKVFNAVLQDLGVTSFRKLAAFGAADVARVNVALKEYRGRLEQDDWIGQAADLHFKKYGQAH